MNSLFSVVTIALLLSWAVSVLVTPLLGYSLIKIKPATGSGHDPYATKFYRLFRQLLVWCLTNRKLVLSMTVVCFIGSIFLFKFVKQEFFPPSTRPELIVEMTLPEGSSLQATEREAQNFAASLDGDPNIDSYSYYVGEGAPRFVLAADPTLPASNYAQFLFVAKDVKAREALRQKVQQLFAESFPQVRGHIKIIQTGPPSSYPVMLRVSGYDHGKVREIARQVSLVMAANPYIRDINFDWNEKSKVVHLAVDQDKARVLGVNSQTLAANLQMQLSGTTIAEFRKKDKTVGTVLRIASMNRDDLAHIKDLNLPIGDGRFVPLEQIATISLTEEDGLIWRRDLKPTITVQADVAPGTTGNDTTKKVYEDLKELRESLPPGYSIDIGGALERSKISMGYLLQPVPAMFLVIITLLMFQLQKLSLTFLTLLTAPLGIIGTGIALVLTQRPMGFVTEVGILALGGMIIRNAVILIDQIQQHISAGESPWDAIIDSTILRFRPIMLTAGAAILGMLPLVSSVFWGPMAVAIAGGLLGATLLTLLVLPTMYAAWFRIDRNSPSEPKIAAPALQPPD